MFHLKRLTAFALLISQLALAGDVDESIAHCQGLLQRMKRGDDAIRALSKDASFLKSVGRRIATTDGNRLAGLYRVETVDPRNAPAVLKIYMQEANGGAGPLPSQLSELTPSLLMQAHLGSVVIDGYPLAPPIYGILDYREVKALGLTGMRGTPTFGVVMQYIEGVWNYPNSTVPCPFKGKLDADIVRKRIHAITTEMVKTRIMPRDLQLFVTAESRVYAADLDSHLFIAPDNTIYGGAWTVDHEMRQHLRMLSTPQPMFTSEGRQLVSENAQRIADHILLACAAE